MTILHGLNSAIFVAIGLFSLLKAHSIAAWLGISFDVAAAVTEFRATYGGMYLAAGLYFAAPLFAKQISWYAISWFGVFLYFGFGMTRLFGILNESPQTNTMYFFCVTELIMGTICLLSLRWK